MPYKRILLFAVIIAGIFIGFDSFGQEFSVTPDEVTIKLGMEGKSFTKVINIFILMTALSLVPAFVMMMTSFVRITIVLEFLKKAMGTQAPSSKMISALALFLTIFIMQPTWTRIYNESIIPYSEEKISQEVALERAIDPMKTFMLKQMSNRKEVLVMFMELQNIESPESPDQLPMTVVVPAFMLSELKTAFQMGFLIYLPFLLVDIVIATTLMSMGMMMLPPMMISMPFKLLMFIIVDGWTLLVGTLLKSFY